MAVSLRFVLKESTQEKLERLPDKALEGLSKALVQGAFLLKARVQTLIRNSPRGGRVYRRGGKTHTASKPGDPPARDSSDLINRIFHRVDDPQTVRVGSDMMYAGFLEEGTGKMEARPYLEPAIEQEKDRIDNLVERFIEEAISE